MKTKILIEVETTKVRDIYNTDNPEEWTEDNKITEQFEKEIHDAVYAVLDRNVQQNIEDEVIENLSENGHLPDGWDSFADITDKEGEVKIKVMHYEP